MTKTIFPDLEKRIAEIKAKNAADIGSLQMKVDKAKNDVAAAYAALQAANDAQDADKYIKAKKSVSDAETCLEMYLSRLNAITAAVPSLVSDKESEQIYKSVADEQIRLENEFFAAAQKHVAALDILFQEYMNAVYMGNTVIDDFCYSIHRPPRGNTLPPYYSTQAPERCLKSFLRNDDLRAYFNLGAFDENL